MSRADLEREAEEKYPILKMFDSRSSVAERDRTDCERAAYIRGRLDQAEADAQIARSMSENEPDGYYGQACYEISAEIQKGV